MSISRTSKMKDLHAQTEKWVGAAQADAQAARLMFRGRSATWTIFAVQQSMEGATKAFAAANGMEHHEIRRVGHQHVRLLMMTLDNIVNRTGKSAYVNHMVGGHYFKVDDYDVGKQLARAMEVTSDPGKTPSQRRKEANGLFESAVTASSKDVKKLLRLFDVSHSVLMKMSSLLNHVKRRDLVLELPAPKGDSKTTLTDQIIDQCRLERREFHESEAEIFDELEELLHDIIADGGKGNASLSGRHLVAQFRRYMRFQTALLGILIIGTIVWPHEGYPRYPAPPGAPRNVTEAAKKFNGQRRLGIEHYTNDLGVVKHLKAIVERSERITSYLRYIQDNYYLLEGPTKEQP